MKPREERFTRPELAGVHLRALHWADDRGDDSAPALILLHGAGGNAHWWDHLAPELARDYRVTALDFRGHGASDHPQEHRKGAFAEDLGALVAHLGAPPVILVGASLGAHVAASHASGRDGVRALVLIDPSRGASRAGRRAAQLALMLRPTYATRAQAIERFRFLPRAHAAEDLRLAIAERSVRKEADGRYGYNFDPRWFSVEPAGTPDFSGIRCPTLVVRGESSSLLPTHGAEAIVSEIPDARIAEVEGAGHHVQLDRPGDTLAVVRRFLDAVL